MGEQTSNAEGPLVLIIDDDTQLSSTLSDMLDLEGYRVLTAANGNKALRLLEKGRPDLVITDILMPDKGGVEMVVELTGKYPGLPVIAMSGGGRTGNMDFLEIARNAGAKATLSKPIDLDVLLDTVAQALSSASGDAAS